MRLERLILILAKEFIIGRHLGKWSMDGEGVEAKDTIKGVLHVVGFIS